MTVAKVRRLARLLGSGQTMIRNCMRRRQHRYIHTTDMTARLRTQRSGTEQ